MGTHEETRWIRKLLQVDQILYVPLKRVYLRQDERVNVRIGRDGGLQHFELHGLLALHICDEKWARIRMQLENNDTRGIQLQTHPNVDKELFRACGQIGLKVPTKPFPLNTDVGVLKWRLQAQDETSLPLSSKDTISMSARDLRN